MGRPESICCSTMNQEEVNTNVPMDGGRLHALIGDEVDRREIPELGMILYVLAT